MSSINVESAFSRNVLDYEMDEPISNSKLSRKCNNPCKCNNPYCELKYVPSVLADKIVRDRDFADYFPDLFIENVPKEYTIADFHSIFNVYGTNALSTITIVPGNDSNIVIVCFNAWNISYEMYKKTLCLRWKFYSKTGMPGKHMDIRRASIYEFDETLWKSVPRFGVVYDYSAYWQNNLLSDPRAVHLHEYLLQEPYIKRLTEDAAVLVNDDCEYYEEKFAEFTEAEEFAMYDALEDAIREEFENEEYDKLYSIPLEEGEIDESDVAVADDDSTIRTTEDHEDEDDSHMYEYCEIEGIIHRRLRNNPADCGGYAEDPDELHYRINNAKGFENKAYEFWK